MLYAHDTGIFTPKVFDYLRDNPILLDAISLDHTFCSMQHGLNHMGLPDNVKVMEWLKENGNISKDAVCIISHFSHNGQISHAQLEAAAWEHGWLAAYDSMKITL